MSEAAGPQGGTQQTPSMSYLHFPTALTVLIQLLKARANARGQAEEQSEPSMGKAGSAGELIHQEWSSASNG